MIRFITVLTLVVLCVGFIATSAVATPPHSGYGTVVAPPGNTTFAVLRVLAQWVIGSQRLSVFTVHSCVNGVKVFAVYSVWFNHFTRETTVQLDRSVVTGTCS